MENAKYDEIAILVRSKWSAEKLEPYLIQEKIPYNMSTQIKNLYEKKEVKLFMAYLKLLKN